VAALRSGDYRQGRQRLRSVDEAGFTYCCLGVLCDVAASDGVGIWTRLPGLIRDTPVFFATTNGDGSSVELPPSVANWAGTIRDPIVTQGDDVNHLSRINDDGGTFEEIADLIEKFL
jgi:hypothetical protein